MSAMWNRTLVYLGLREEPDEIYDQLPARFVPEDDPYAEHAPARDGARGRSQDAGRSVDPQLVTSAAGERRGGVESGASHAVRTLRVGDGGAGMDNVRALRVAETTPESDERRSVTRVAQVEVSDFDDVEAVGARYRTGQAVLFDLSGASAATARRVVDFVAGLTYALRGNLTKVGSRAFLLVPDGARLTADERRRLTELGYRVPTGSDR